MKLPKVILQTLKTFEPNFDRSKYKIAVEISLKNDNNKTPLDICQIITSVYPDSLSVLTALLFFSVNKKYLVSVKSLFGKEVVNLYNALTKFKIRCSSYYNVTQKTFDYINTLDPKAKIRLLLIIFAFLLYKILSSEGKYDESRLICNELSQVYLELFNEVKIDKIKVVLQNSCLETLQPKKYKFVISLVKRRYPNFENSIIKVIDNLLSILKDANIEYTVTGRIKSPYSITKKMINKSKYFDQLNDIIGIRIVVEKEDECYQILNVIHGKFYHIPSTFKDYIQFPKKNGYQSLHTIILDNNFRKIEIQLRTRQMHFTAEFGTASHLQYKMQLINNPDWYIVNNTFNNLLLGKTIKSF